jgi:Ca2+-binding RTX toxin-like protein
VVGSAFDDIIKSNGSLNTIDGGNGDDVLQSWIDGQTDVMNGGAGEDTIDYSAFAQASGLTISLGQNGSGVAFTTASNGAVAVEDGLISIENVIGTSHDDTIRGNSEANVLNGGGGNDRIIGGQGGDDLVGGSGADTFVYELIADSRGAPNQLDHILDFERGVDKIDFSALDANVNVAGDQAFVIVDSFTGQAGQLVAVAGGWGGADQSWLADVTGDGVADFRIYVDTTDGSPNFLTSSDFLL